MAWICRWLAHFACAAAVCGACASPQAAGGNRAECYRLEDCAEGLVCVKNACTNRLTAIVGEAPMTGAGGAGGLAGAAADASVGRSDAGPPPSGGTAGAAGTVETGGVTAAGGAAALSGAGGTRDGGGNPATGGTPGTRDGGKP